MRVALIMLAATVLLGVLAGQHALLLLSGGAGVLFLWTRLSPTLVLLLTSITVGIALNWRRPGGLMWLRRIPRLRWMAWALVLGATSWAFLAGWFAWWSPPQPHVHVPGLASWTPPVAVVALFLAAVNSLAEELFWRYSVAMPLLTASRTWTAVLGQGLGFGLMHVDGFPSGWLGVVATAAFGMAAMLLVLKARSLWPAVLAHMLADLTIVMHLLAT
jgi:uncharacterized protein